MAIRNYNEIGRFLVLQFRSQGLNIPNDAAAVFTQHATDIDDKLFAEFGYRASELEAELGTSVMEFYAAYQYVTFVPELTHLSQFYEVKFKQAVNAWMEQVIYADNDSTSSEAQSYIRELAIHGVYLRDSDAAIVADHIARAKEIMKSDAGGYDPDVYAVESAREAIRMYVFLRMTPITHPLYAEAKSEWPRLVQAWAYDAAGAAHEDYFEDSDNRNRLQEFCEDIFGDGDSDGGGDDDDDTPTDEVPEAPVLGELVVNGRSSIDIPYTLPDEDEEDLSVLEIYRSIGGTIYILIATIDVTGEEGNSGTYTDTGLLTNTEYSYRALVRDEAEQASDYSDVVTATTDDVVAPTFDSFSFADATHYPGDIPVITVEVSAGTDSIVSVQAKTAGLSPAALTAVDSTPPYTQSFLDSVSPGTYSFTLEVITGGDGSPFTLAAPSTYTVLAAPPFVLGEPPLSFEPGESSLTAGSVAGQNPEFRFLVYSDPAATNLVEDSGWQSSNSYTPSNLTNDTDYWYTAQGRNGDYTATITGAQLLPFRTIAVPSTETAPQNIVYYTDVELVDIRWDFNNESYYEESIIERAPSVGGVPGSWTIIDRGEFHWFRDTTATPGNTYFYRIRNRYETPLENSFFRIITETYSNYRTIGPITVAPADVKYYVNASTGNDSNDGTLAASPWKTLQKADGEAVAQAIAGNSVLIEVAAGTYRPDQTVKAWQSFGNPQDNSGELGPVIHMMEGTETNKDIRFKLADGVVISGAVDDGATWTDVSSTYGEDMWSRPWPYKLGFNRRRATDQGWDTLARTNVFVDDERMTDYQAPQDWTAEFVNQLDAVARLTQEDDVEVTNLTDAPYMGQNETGLSIKYLNLGDHEELQIGDELIRLRSAYESDGRYYVNITRGINNTDPELHAAGTEFTYSMGEDYDLTDVQADEGSVYVDELNEIMYLHAPDGVNPNTADVEYALAPFVVRMSKKNKVMFDGPDWTVEKSCGLFSDGLSAGMYVAECEELWLENHTFRWHNYKGLNVVGNQPNDPTSRQTWLRERNGTYTDNGGQDYGGYRLVEVIRNGMRTDRGNWRGHVGEWYRFDTGHKSLNESHNYIETDFVFNGCEGDGNWIDLDVENARIRRGAIIGSRRYGAFWEALRPGFLVDRIRLINNAYDTDAGDAKGTVDLNFTSVGADIRDVIFYGNGVANRAIRLSADENRWHRRSWNEDSEWYFYEVPIVALDASTGEITVEGDLLSKIVDWEHMGVVIEQSTNNDSVLNSNRDFSNNNNPTGNYAFSAEPYLDGNGDTVFTTDVEFDDSVVDGVVSPTFNYYPRDMKMRRVYMFGYTDAAFAHQYGVSANIPEFMETADFDYNIYDSGFEVYGFMDVNGDEDDRVGFEQWKDDLGDQGAVTPDTNSRLIDEPTIADWTADTIFTDIRTALEPSTPPQMSAPTVNDLGLVTFTNVYRKHINAASVQVSVSSSAGGTNIIDTVAVPDNTLQLEAGTDFDYGSTYYVKVREVSTTDVAGPWSTTTSFNLNEPITIVDESSIDAGLGNRSFTVDISASVDYVVVAVVSEAGNGFPVVDVSFDGDSLSLASDGTRTAQATQNFQISASIWVEPNPTPGSDIPVVVTVDDSNRDVMVKVFGLKNVASNDDITVVELDNGGAGSSSSSLIVDTETEGERIIDVVGHTTSEALTAGSNQLDVETATQGDKSAGFSTRLETAIGSYEMDWDWETNGAFAHVAVSFIKSGGETGPSGPPVLDSYTTTPSTVVQGDVPDFTFNITPGGDVVTSVQGFLGDVLNSTAFTTADTSDPYTQSSTMTFLHAETLAVFVEVEVDGVGGPYRLSADNLVINPLALATLTAEADDQEPSGPITLEWSHSQSSGRTLLYDLQLQESGGDWSTLIVDQTDLSNTSYTISGGTLSSNTTYEWRVATKNGVVVTDFTDPDSFTTIETGAPSFNGLTSSPSTVVAGDQPTLTFDVVAGDDAITSVQGMTGTEGSPTALTAVDSSAPYTQATLSALTTAETIAVSVEVITGGAGSPFFLGTEDLVVNALATPTLTPEADDQSASSDITLNWTHSQSSGRSLTYDVQVQESGGDWSSLVDSDSDISSTSHTISGSTLDEGTEYEWRVRAKNGSVTGDWSSADAFSTYLVPPTFDSLTSSPSTVVAGDQPTLTFAVTEGTDSITSVQGMTGTEGSPTALTAVDSSAPYTQATLSALNTAETIAVSIEVITGGIGSPFFLGTEDLVVNALAAPSLTSEADDQDADSAITLEWSHSQSSGRSLTYDLQVRVSGEPDWTTPAVDQTGLSGTSYEISGGTLGDAITYEWRMRAVNGAVTSDWSSTDSFTTADPAAPTFDSITTSPSTVVQGDTPTITFNVTPGDDSITSVQGQTGTQGSPTNFTAADTSAPYTQAALSELTTAETIDLYARIVTGGIGSPFWTGPQDLVVNALVGPTLTAEADEQDAHDDITLEWSHSQSSGRSLTYHVQVKEQGDDWDTESIVDEEDIATASYTISGDTLTNNKTYEWRARAKNSTVFGAWSSTDTFTTWQYPTFDTLTSSPSTVVAGDQPTLTFGVTAGTDPITSVQGVEGDEAPFGLLTNADASAPYSISTIAALNTAETLSVHARFVTGGDSVDSPLDIGTKSLVVNALAAPTLTAEADGQDPSTTITLEWTHSQSSGRSLEYELQVRVDGEPDWTTPAVDATEISGTSYNITGSTLGASTDYEWRVRAVNGAVTSDWSTTDIFTTGTVASGISDVNDIPDLVEAFLSWTGTSLYSDGGSTEQTTNGGAIQRWTSQASGSSSYIEEGSAGSQPTLLTSGQNSKKAVRFDGSEYLIDDGTNTSATASSQTHFIVFEPQSVDTNDVIWALGNNFRVYHDGTNYILRRLADSSNVTLTGGGTTGMQLLTIVATATTVKWAWGDDALTDESSAPNSHYSDGGGIGFAANINTSGQTQMDMYGWIYCDAELSSGDIDDVREWIASSDELNFTL